MNTNNKLFCSNGMGAIIIEVKSANPDSISRYIKCNSSGQALISSQLITRRLVRLVKAYSNTA